MAHKRVSLRDRADAMLRRMNADRIIREAIAMSHPMNRGIHWEPPAKRDNEYPIPLNSFSCRHEILLTLPCRKCGRSKADARAQARARGERMLV
jgi:hypothetical protein